MFAAGDRRTGLKLGTTPSTGSWAAIASSSGSGSGSGSGVSTTLRHGRGIGNSSRGVSALWDAAGDWSGVGTGGENSGSGTLATGIRTGVGGRGGGGSGGGSGSGALWARSASSGTCPGGTGSSVPTLSLISTWAGKTRRLHSAAP
jgi:hypothetical protein